MLNVGKMFCNYNVTLFLCHMNLWPIGRISKENWTFTKGGGGGGPAILHNWMSGDGLLCGYHTCIVPKKESHHQSYEGSY